MYKTLSAAVFGIDAYVVDVEVDIGPGDKGVFNAVGLPDNAVRESRERVRAAQLRIRNSRISNRDREPCAGRRAQGKDRRLICRSRWG